MEHALSLSLQIPASYSVYGETRDELTRETIFLLHGYGQRKDLIWHLMRGAFEPHLAAGGVRVVVINGPFPVPYLKADAFKEAYAWYFYSVKEQRALIEPSVCDPLFEAIIKKENAQSRPARVVGYSQGGFMIPRLALQLPNLRHTIGVGTGYRRERYAEKLHYRLDGVHGLEDTTMTTATCQADYEKLRPLSDAGEFILVSGGHRIESSIVEAVKSLIGQVPLW